MNSPKIILILTGLIMLSVNVSAQKRTFTRVADEAFQDQRYSIAIEKYQKAYTKARKSPTEKNRITYQLGECYRLTGDSKRAKIQYKRLIRDGYDSKEPTILVKYADALKAEGELDDARTYYEAYSKKVPDDPRGKYGIEACDSIPYWTEHETKYEVNDEKGLNSRDADFAPTYSSDNYNSLIFTSTREGSKGKKTDEWTNENFKEL